VAAFGASVVAVGGAMLDASELVAWSDGSGLLLAGLLAFLMLIAMERIAAWQSPETLARRGAAGATPALTVRTCLIIASAALMLVVLSFSEEVQDTAAEIGALTTLGWSLTALVLMSLGFLWKSLLYRRTALAVFACSLLRIVAVDVFRLELVYRMLAFLCLGGCLLAVSFLYIRFQEQIRRWL
jgi:hypothetical protein